MKQVFLYMDDAPRQTGSGAQLRFYSNLRAYVDLGFKAEVIRIGAGGQRVDESALCGADLVDVPVTTAPRSVSGRLSYRLGIPNRAANRYYFVKHDAVSQAALQRALLFPDAIHQFEGESMANVIPFIGIRNSIWSLHDVPSQATSASTRIECETDRRGPTKSELRDLRFARRVERALALQAPLILGISKDDCDMIRRDWGVRSVEYLPMSVAGEDRSFNHRNWMPEGKLRLLHVGRISHLPSYRSLEYLLTEILPLLDPETLDGLDIRVVGTIEPEHPRARKIMDLAKRFPQIKMLGFVEDLDAAYASADLHIVASTEATGLRTRIIESFAARVPVITTAVGSRGIVGLENGRNVIVANTAADFAHAIERVSGDPRELERISSEARALYDRTCSRRTVARELNRCLQEYFPELNSSAD